MDLGLLRLMTWLHRIQNSVSKYAGLLKKKIYKSLKLNCKIGKYFQNIFFKKWSCQFIPDVYVHALTVRADYAVKEKCSGLTLKFP